MSTEGFKRKLTTIFSADVAGYSRLMGEDEAATVKTLTAYRGIMSELIKQHGGRVVDSPGDNLLAEFTSVVDAVQCGVAVQKELQARNAELPENRRMQFRVGINLGDVIEEEDRIYGDGVNIAARLEAMADPGGICISKTAFDHIESKLPLGYQYLGEQTVKNITRPVGAYKVLMEPRVIDEGEGEKPKGVPIRRRKPFLAGGVAVLVILIVAAIWHFYFRPPPIPPADPDRMAFPLPDKPSIAVLPFVNMSGDSDQEYIADGFSENIITALSNIPSMFVIARNSTFTYKGKPIKVQKVSEDLGVRYVLEGSIQKSGDRLRVSAQLIDALKGHHLWAKRYDREMKDLFAIQDEITKEIAIALQVELTTGEQARVWHKTDNLEAWGYCTKATSHFTRFTREDNAKARELFGQAVKLDPEYAFAWAMLGWTHLIEAWFGYSASPAESFKSAFELASKAAKIDENHPEVRMLFGMLYLLQKKFDQAVAEGEKAIALGPNNATDHYLFCFILSRTGRPAEAIAMAEKAIRLHPHYPARYLGALATSYFMAGRYKEAMAKYKDLLERDDKDPRWTIFAHLFMTSAYMKLGEEEEAGKHAEEVLKLDPKSSIESLRKYFSAYKYPEKMEPFLDDLKKAGIPDKPALPLPDKPSIAVLPFTNISGVPEQEYFSDGMTEDLITDLSKISGLFVIARNSVFQYKGKPMDVKKICRELGVRYLLEGSVRRADNRVRISAQLIDGTTGGHVWAERYDRELEEIFSLQDEVTEQIVEALSVKLIPEEQKRIHLKGTKNPEAYDLALRGWAYFQQYSQETNALAKEVFEKAIGLDPSYASAHIGLVWTKLVAWRLGWSKDPKIKEQALEMAKRSVAVNESLSQAHTLLGTVYLWTNQHDEAIVEFERAIALDPNDAEALYALSSAMTFVGRPNEAIKIAKKAMRLNPHYPERYIYNLGRAYFQIGEYSEAIPALGEALVKNPNFPPILYYMAASYGQLGELELAREKVEQIKRLRPNFRSEIGHERGLYKYEKDVERLAEGLRKAGLR